MMAILIASLIMVLPIAYGQSFFQRTIPNLGIIVKSLELGIYTDNDCITPLSSLDWGICEPGSNKTSTMYVRNEGVVNATFIVEAANWNPVNASLSLTITSRADRNTLTPQEGTTVTLLLAISSEIMIKSFAFDINIIGHN